jgi:hypothetical protein
MPMPAFYESEMVFTRLKLNRSTNYQNLIFVVDIISEKKNLRFQLVGSCFEWLLACFSSTDGHWCFGTLLNNRYISSILVVYFL